MTTVPFLGESLVRQTPARPWATLARDVTLAQPTPRPTPAQDTNYQNFVVDVPVQGPTDVGMRAGSCWWAQHVIPKPPACVDCPGFIPAWTRQKLNPGGPAGPNSGIGDNMEAISFGGVGVSGFALSAAGDPEVWTKLTNDQQVWVRDTLTRLNDLIYRSTGTKCASYAPTITASGGCFQSWYNSVHGKDYSVKKLRTDGVFDQETLDALITTARVHSVDFPTPFPTAAVEKKGLSTGAMVGLYAGGAAVVGGIIYVATRKSGKGRRRR